MIMLIDILSWPDVIYFMDIVDFILKCLFNILLTSMNDSINQNYLNATFV